MKLMHLSDLHLGKNIFEESMIDDQRYILDVIIDIVIKRDIDVVMIAGDVYDKVVPSVEAVNLFSSPNNCIICSSVSIPIALNNVVTGIFLVLSTLA